MNKSPGLRLSDFITLEICKFLKTLVIIFSEWSPQRDSREYSIDSLGSILKALQGVLKTNPRGRRLRGFLAKGLAEDVAEGFVVNIPGMSSTHW